jgi:hypothetical protein
LSTLELIDLDTGMSSDRSRPLLVYHEPGMLLQEGQKAIYHLEAFVAKIMSEYKSWSIATLG